MATNENEIPLKLTVDGKEASKSLADFESQANKSIESIEKSFESFKHLAETLLVAFGFEKLIEGLSDVIGEAAKADQAVRDLAVSFAGTGEFSEQSVEHFKHLADAIEETTTVSDDAVLKGATLAKSFGLSNDQAEKLVKTAVDLAAATGTDLNTAVQQLGATYSGTAGRLGKVTPALKLLSEEQLRNGEAIDILQKKYQGFAEASTQTFSGALTQTGNAFDQILKGLGQVITQNPVVIEAIKELGDVFKQVSKFVQDNQQDITQYISQGLKKLISFLPDAIQAFTFFIAVLDAVVDSLAEIIRVSTALSQIFIEVTKPILDLTEVLTNGLVGGISKVISFVLDLANKIPGVGNALKEVGIDIEGIGNLLDDFGSNRLDAAFTLDTSASDSFKKFAQDSLEQVNQFSQKSKIQLNGFLETVGVGAAGLIPKAEKLVEKFNDLDESLTGVTKGIKNTNKELDNSAEIAKRLEALKGAFDKVKGAIEPLQLEIDKLTLSQNALIDAEFERSAKNLSNAAEELALQGKLNDGNQKLLTQYAELIQTKQALAKEKLSIGDFTIGEFVSAFSAQISNLKATFKSFDIGSFVDSLNEAGDAFSIDSLIEGGKAFATTVEDGFVAAVSKGAEAFSKVTLGELADGIGTAVLSFADSFGTIVSGIISGDFVTQALNVLQAFGNFPSTILGIFQTAGDTFKGIADALPKVIESFVSQVPNIINNIVGSVGTIIDELVKSLPQIGATFANAIGDIFTKIAEKLPDIVNGLIQALEPLIAQIFERVLPALIKALPGVIKALANAIAPILTTIFKALPEIIKDIFAAIPEIVKALADALPGIVVVLAENIGPIVEALVEGLIKAAPDIIIALVDSLLIDGGLERIVKALILAVPRIAEALVVGIVHGLGQAALAIGQAIGRGFVAIGENIGNKIGGDFSNKISGAFKNFISGVQNVFSFGASSIVGAIGSGANQLLSIFQNAIAGIGSSITNGFASQLGNLYSTIVNGFNNIFGALYNTISGAFQGIFGGLFDSIRNGGNAIADAFYKPVQDLKDFLNQFKFPDITGDIGGGGNGNIHIAGIDTGFHFADGGQISQVPTGFPNDSLFAHLQSNELVVNQDLSSKLQRFLDGNSTAKLGDSGDLNAAILTKILAELKQPQQANVSVEINGRVLANAILDLQRNNSRLSA